MRGKKLKSRNERTEISNAASNKKTKLKYVKTLEAIISPTVFEGASTALFVSPAAFLTSTSSWLSPTIICSFFTSSIIIFSSARLRIILLILLMTQLLLKSLR